MCAHVRLRYRCRTGNSLIGWAYALLRAAHKAEVALMWTGQRRLNYNCGRVKNVMNWCGLVSFHVSIWRRPFLLVIHEVVGDVQCYGVFGLPNELKPQVAEIRCVQVRWHTEVIASSPCVPICTVHAPWQLKRSSCISGPIVDCHNVATFAQLMYQVSVV